MPDTKRGREEQAREEEKRQRRREVEEARERGDEPEPTTDRTADEGEPGDEEWPPTCHRRGCDRPAAFRVLERYQEETGHGPVEAEAYLCREHTAEEGPTNLDGVYEGYVFLVEPLPESVD